VVGQCLSLICLFLQGLPLASCAIPGQPDHHRIKQGVWGVWPRAISGRGAGGVSAARASFGGRARRVVPQPRAKGEAGNEKECTPSTSDGPTSTQRAPPRAQACHVGVGIRVVRAGVMVVVVLAVGGFGSWKTRGFPPTVTVTLQISVGWSRLLALEFLTHLP